jgi:hypothetical protein
MPSGWIEGLHAIATDPGVSRWVSLTAAGALGALVSAALDAGAVSLPRLRCGRLELGLLGPLVASVAMAHFVDHDFQTAFLGSLCAMSALAHIRSRIRAVFEAEIERVRDGGEPHGDDA